MPGDTPNTFASYIPRFVLATEGPASPLHPFARVISTGGPAKPVRNGEISTRPPHIQSPRPNVTTPPHRVLPDTARRAFTLIELLVVISIVVLLMALLFPALQRARKQARAVTCQSQMHQWGLIFTVYAHDNDNASFTPIPWWGGYEGETPGLVLCPSATKPLPGDPVGWGDAFHAYARTRSHMRPWSSDLAFALGSYGLNEWIGADDPGWRTHHIRAATHVPLMFDSACLTAEPEHHCPPPQQEGYDPECVMSPLCINRHHGGINMLFMDFSARKVGLKELWTLQWHKDFETAGPWTQAGGALPEDWPEWMRTFKDH